MSSSPARIAGSFEILLQLFHVEAEFARHGQRLFAADRTVGRKQLLMEFEEFLAGNLLAGGGGDLGGVHGIRAENREILEHDAQFRLRLHQAHEIREGAFAIAAIVIEELDQGDLALGIADDRLEGGIEQFLLVVADGVAAQVRFLDALLLLQLHRNLAQHLWMRDEIGMDDVFDLRLLRVVEFRASRNDKSGESQSGGEGRPAAAVSHGQLRWKNLTLFMH